MRAGEVDPVPDPLRAFLCRSGREEDGPLRAPPCSSASIGTIASRNSPLPTKATGPASPARLTVLDLTLSTSGLG